MNGSANKCAATPVPWTRENLSTWISGCCPNVGRVLSLTIVAAVVFSILGFTPAQAAETKFTSCAQMHETYKYGIAKNKKAQRRAVKDGMYKPAARKRVYKDSYKTLVRDKDGVMCEVPR